MRQRSTDGDAMRQNDGRGRCSMSFQLDLEPVTFQLKNSQIVLFHQIDDGFDIVELQNDILLVVGCMLGTGRKIAQAALQFRRISSHCLNIAANLD